MQLWSLRLATVAVPSLDWKSDKLCNPLREQCQLSTELMSADCVVSFFESSARELHLTVSTHQHCWQFHWCLSICFIGKRVPVKLALEYKPFLGACLCFTCLCDARQVSTAFWPQFVLERGRRCTIQGWTKRLFPGSIDVRWKNHVRCTICG